MKKYAIILIAIISFIFLMSCGDGGDNKPLETVAEVETGEELLVYHQMADDSYEVNLVYPYKSFKSLVIPAEYNGKKVTTVTGINDAYIDILVLSEGITRLCDSALERSKIKKIIIPKSLEIVDNNAFSCHGTEEIYYNGSLEQWAKFTANPHYTSNPMTCAKKLYLADGNGTIKLDGRKYNSLQTVVIPETMTEIPSGLLLNASNIEKVVLHNNVTKIGESAFECCTNLREINIPDSISSIGMNAFFNCNSLENITIPSNLKEIPSGFIGYSSIKEIKIPNSVESIGSGAFAGCKNIEELTIPNSIKKIGSESFYNCENLNKVYYDGTLEDWIKIEIGSGGNPAYRTKVLYLLDSNGNIENNNRKYSALREIIIPEGTTRIGAGTFQGLKVNNVSLPESIKEIGDYAFNNCEIVWEFELPTHIEKVGRYAFNNCYTLTGFSSDSIKEIGEFAFYKTGIKNLELANSLETVGNKAFESCKIKEAIIPAIASGAINDNPIEKLEISNGKIPDDTLTYCDTLTEITLNNITAIGQNFFSRANIKTLTLTEGIKEINEGLFASAKVTELLIPKSVKKINLFSIFSSSYLNNIYYTGTVEDWCNINIIDKGENHSYFQPHKYNLYLLDENGEKEYNSFNYSLLEDLVIPDSISVINKYQFCGANIVNLTIPSTVSYIDKAAFYYCYKLKNVKLNNCEELKDYAFKECKRLENINLESVKKIGNQCFYECENLKKAYLNKIEAIYSEAFYYCSNLEELVLLGYTTKPYERAFYKCDKLKKVELSKRLTNMNYIFYVNENVNIYYDGTIDDWLKVQFDYLFLDIDNFGKLNMHFPNIYFLDPNGEIEFNSNKYKAITSLTLSKIETTNLVNLSGLRDLKTLIFAEGITDIPSYSCNYLPSLETIVFPSTLKSIGPYSFNECSSVKELVFPSSLETIGYKSFNNWDVLEKIEFNESLTLISDSFWGCDSLTKIILPKSLTDIGVYVFINCSHLTRIYYEGNNSYIINKISSNIESVLYVYTENKDQEKRSGKWWYYQDNEIIELVI